MSEEQEKLNIKSPVFTPKSGWGGKLKKWSGKNFNSKTLPFLSILVLVVGIYGVLNKKSDTTKWGTETDTQTEVIEKIAQPRQGLTHLARAALADFLNAKEIGLSPAQKLFAETYLVTKLNSRLINPGDTVTFHINDLTETIKKAQTLTPYQLFEWGKYLNK